MPHATSKTVLDLLRDVMIAQPGLSRREVCLRTMRESNLTLRYLAKELDRLIRSGNVCPSEDDGPESLTWVSDCPLPRSYEAAQAGPTRILRAAGTWTRRDMPLRDPLTAALFGAPPG